MDHGRLSPGDIKEGYRHDNASKSFLCNYCEKVFPEGQVFPSGGKFYDACRAAALHVEEEHGGVVMRLINSESKYNTLTDNQRELLTLFYSGMKDKDIAEKLGLAVSTVRRQKFTFREKAKQAKMYLAIFEGVFEGKPPNEEAIIPIHENAPLPDDRYVITEQERTHIIETFFEKGEPLRLKQFSPKEKNKVVILARIAELFETGRNYTEGEVNQILTSVYDDYTTIRRYLIIYGFMERTDGGSSYWRT